MRCTTPSGDNASSFSIPKPLPNRFLAVQDLFRQTVTLFQRQTLNQCLVDAEADLRTYQAEINRLKAKIILLEGRRNDLQRDITKYRSLLSPIRRLPTEILAHIFSFCCKENHIAPEEQPDVLTLSAVCRCWRDLALASPRLWSSMTLHLGRWGHSQYTRYTRRFRDWVELLVERSSGAPLDLEFHSDGLDDLEPFMAGIDILLDQSNRWRSFKSFPRMGITHLNDPTSPFRHLRGYLPNLERLHLNRRSPEDMVPSDFIIFNECSKLHSIHLSDVSLPVGFRCEFPWSQIRNLALSGHPSMNILQVIMLCTNVERIDVDCDILETTRSQTRITTLSKVRHVSVHGSKDQGSLFFSAFTFPSLSSLSICGPWSYTPFELSALSNFFLRSSCPITSLSIEDLPLSDLDMLRLLSLIPTVTNLIFKERQVPVRRTDGQLQLPSNKVITRTLLDHFIADAESNRPCKVLPRLTDLNFTTFPLEPSDRQALERLLALRLPTLQAFTLVVVGLEDVEQQSVLSDYESLECFKDVGMRVHYTYSKNPYARQYMAKSGI